VERFVHTGIDSYLGMGSPPNHNTLHIFRFDAIIYVKLKCIATSINEYKLAPTEEHQQVTAFHHSDAAWQNTIKSEMDVTRDYADYADATLARYLERPVQINDFVWTTTAGATGAGFNPWTLFLSNPHVADKIRGYRLLQGKLHVRFIINGGPMLYGKLIAAYLPRYNQDDHVILSSLSDAAVTQLSMFPHVYMDATTSSGGVLDLPFFCPDNWIDLLGGTHDEMGYMIVRSINDLLHANTATANVSIKVYAWMSDVKLCAPTTRAINTYTAQSGEYVAAGGASVSILAAIIAWMKHSKCSYVGSEREQTHHDPEQPMEAHAGDEYGTGVISKPASTMARIAGALSGIPRIKPYATATQIAAEMLGRFAHHMGFSRPNIVGTLDRTKIVNTGLLANTDQHDACVKLTFDSKAEVSVDPRVTGLSDVDEMAFDYIKQKECFLMSATWSEGDPEGHMVAQFSVGPDMHHQVTQDGYTASLLTPMYTLAAPFQYWRGTIVFRFQLVASQLHRGRLRITYDPYLHNTPYDDNEVYTRIIDLAENRDFEIPVSWNHARAWLRVNNRISVQGGSFVASHTDGTRTQTVGEMFHNGALRVEVLNLLTSPNPALAQPVYLNVSVRAGPDFELAGPTSAMIQDLEYLPNTVFVPQGGGYEAQAGEEEVIDEADDIPESPPPITPVGTTDPLEDPLYHVFMGEKISSVRSLIKRYCYHRSRVTTNAEQSLLWTDFNFPSLKGQFECRSNTVDAGSLPASQTYNFAANTFLTWFKPCYVGWRGALRVKYLPNHYQGQWSSATMYLKRLSQPLDEPKQQVVGSDFNSNISFDVDVFGGVSGSAVTFAGSEGALEAEFPYISYRRFAHCRTEMDGSGSNDAPYTGEHLGHMVYAFTNGGIVHKYVAAGDDFSFHFFVGQPLIIRRSTPRVDSGILLPIVPTV
jgi:hypothetical protein